MIYLLKNSIDANIKCSSSLANGHSNRTRCDLDPANITPKGKNDIVDVTSTLLSRDVVK